VRFKGGNDGLDALNSFTEKWEKRLTLSNLRLSERFANDELRIIIHFRAKDTLEKWACCLTEIRSIEPLALEQIRMTNGNKLAMLVDVIKVMNHPQRSIPSLVWFEGIDSFYRRLPRALYFSSLQSFIVLGHIENGKADSFTAPCSDRPSLSGLHELKREMVESTPKVLQHVASNGEKFKTRKGWGFERPGFFSCFRVHIGLNNLEVLITPDFRTRLEVLEVIFGPFEFDQDKYKPIFSGEVIFSGECHNTT